MAKIRKKSGRRKSKPKTKTTIGQLVKREDSFLDQLELSVWDRSYKSNGEKKGSTKTTLLESINQVRNPDTKHRKIVENVWKIKALPKDRTHDGLYKKAKWKAKHVYFSCQFDGQGCQYENVTIVTGLMGYDLQDIDDQTYQRLKDWTHTVAIMKSIGNGDRDYFHLLYCPGLTKESYSGMWEKGNELLQKECGVQPENSDRTKDVTRVRYLPIDENAYYNPHAEPVFVNDVVVSTDFTDSQRKKINRLINDEPVWHKVLVSIAVTKGEAGRELAHSFSAVNSGKYDAKECNKKYDRALIAASKRKKDGIKPATFFWFLGKMGVSYTVPRGIPNLGVVDVDEGEGVSTQVIFDYINSTWVRNTINGQILNLKTGEVVNVETVLTEFRLAFDGVKGAEKRTGAVRDLLQSNRMNTINPIENFFKAAEENYDGGNHIEKYISSLPLINVEAGVLFITDWLIKFYLQARFNITNRSFLILQGGENTGKSMALEWLNPVDGYLKTGPLLTDSKDTRIAMARNTMWNDDELSLRKGEVNKVKAIVSLGTINERVAYAKGEETYKRVCSFCGSTNSYEILQSTEGNTRFSIAGLKDGEKVNWPKYEKIDKSQFWGEVIKLHKDGWLEKNKDAVDEMRKSVNGENIINTAIRDSIIDTLESTTNVEQKNRTVCNTADIIKLIDPLGELHAVQQQAHVREVITKEFGNGRWNGYRTRQGKRVLTRGYPVQLKGKGGEREEEKPEKPGSGTVTAGQETKTKTKTNAKIKTAKKRGRRKNST